MEEILLRRDSWTKKKKKKSVDKAVSHQQIYLHFWNDQEQLKMEDEEVNLH